MWRRQVRTVCHNLVSCDVSLVIVVGVQSHELVNRNIAGQCSEKFLLPWGHVLASGHHEPALSEPGFCLRHTVGVKETTARPPGRREFVSQTSHLAECSQKGVRAFAQRDPVHWLSAFLGSRGWALVVTVQVQQTQHHHRNQTRLDAVRQHGEEEHAKPQSPDPLAGHRCSQQHAQQPTDNVFQSLASLEVALECKLQPGTSQGRRAKLDAQGSQHGRGASLLESNAKPIHQNRLCILPHLVLHQRHSLSARDQELDLVDAWRHSG